MTQLPTPEQLTKGVTRLTNIIPQWTLLIDLDTLDTRYWDTCILGQVFGHFNIGIETLRMSYQDAVDEGFILNIPLDNKDFDSLYKQLDEMWLAVLAERT